MRPILVAALFLVACSASAPSASGDAGGGATDALIPADTAVYQSCRARWATTCGPGGSSGVERLYVSSGVWRCFMQFDLPPADLEMTRACVCANAAGFAPDSVDAIARRDIRLACCGRSAIDAAWCADAGM